MHEQQTLRLAVESALQSLHQIRENLDRGDRKVRLDQPAPAPGLPTAAQRRLLNALYEVIAEAVDAMAFAADEMGVDSAPSTRRRAVS